MKYQVKGKSSVKTQLIMITKHISSCSYFLWFLHFSTASLAPCHEWSEQLQAQQPSLYVSFGAGRLGARMTPYTLMMIFKEKHGLHVMVDKEIKEWIQR